MENIPQLPTNELELTELVLGPEYQAVLEREASGNPAIFEALHQEAVLALRVYIDPKNSEKVEEWAHARRTLDLLRINNPPSGGETT